MVPNPLRSIPSVNEILESAPLRMVIERINRNAVVSTVRTVLDEVRNEFQNAAAEMSLPSVSELADRIARRLETEVASLQPVINATGTLLSEDLGRAPLAGEAMELVASTGRNYASLGLDLATGRRVRPTAAVERLIEELTGAEGALVTNNRPAALVLILAALAGSREVIVARSQLVAGEEGDRLPELAAASGVRLREVGCTNQCRPEDYAQAIGPETAALLLIRPSSYALVDRLAKQVDLDGLAPIGRQHQLPVLFDLGQGGLLDLNNVDLPGYRTASECLRRGADLVLLRGDHFVGGPGAALVAGRKTLIDRLARHPLESAFRPSRLTLAALEGTLRLAHDPEKALHTIPLLSLLTTSVENLQNRAQRLAPQLAALPVIAKAEAVAAVTFLTDHALPEEQLPTWCLALEPREMKVEQFASALRRATPPVICRTEPNRLLFDLRSVAPRQDQELVSAVASLGENSPN